MSSESGFFKEIANEIILFSLRYLLSQNVLLLVLLLSHCNFVRESVFVVQVDDYSSIPAAAATAVSQSIVAAAAIVVFVCCRNLIRLAFRSFPRRNRRRNPGSFGGL